MRRAIVTRGGPAVVVTAVALLAAGLGPGTATAVPVLSGVAGQGLGVREATGGPVAWDPDEPAGLPGSGPIVVSLGDSYISGEAGRWAGNAEIGPVSYWADTGADAYLDGGSAELIPACHRSKAAEIHIGHGVTSVNLACSGAETATQVSEKEVKPGLDGVTATWRGKKYPSQDLMLGTLAAANPGRVKMVVLSIGGNDFGFGDIVMACVIAYFKGKQCHTDPAVTGSFAPERVQRVKTDITNAVKRIGAQMTAAGYDPGDWTLLVQNYPSPLPLDNRYSPTGWPRWQPGGCMFTDSDARWANEEALAIIGDTTFQAAYDSGLPNVKYLDLSAAYVGRRLCEGGVGLVGPSAWDREFQPLKFHEVQIWTQDNAVDKSEWVSQIRIESAIYPPFQLQESFHPNYWGELANRACVYLAWNGGNPQSGSCVLGSTGLDENEWPNMAMVPWYGTPLLNPIGGYVPEPPSPVPAPVPDPVFVPAPAAPTTTPAPTTSATPTPTPTPTPTATSSGPASVTVSSPGQGATVSSGGWFAVRASTTGVAAGTPAFVTVDRLAVATAQVAADGSVLFARVPAKAGSYRVRIGAAPGIATSAVLDLRVLPFGIVGHAVSGRQVTISIATGAWSPGQALRVTRDGRSIATVEVAAAGATVRVTVAALPGTYQVKAMSRQGWAYGLASGAFRLT